MGQGENKAPHTPPNPRVGAVEKVLRSEDFMQGFEQGLQAEQVKQKTDYPETIGAAFDRGAENEQDRIIRIIRDALDEAVAGILVRAIRSDEKRSQKIGHAPMRRKLAKERAAINHKFSVGGFEGYLTVGIYPDNRPGEVFITMSKDGSTLSGLIKGFALATSLALQYGVPLRVLVDKFKECRFEPSGVTGNESIPHAHSIYDYLFRWLEQKFLPTSDGSKVDAFEEGRPIVEAEPPLEIDVLEQAAKIGTDLTAAEDPTK